MTNAFWQGYVAVKDTARCGSYIIHPYSANVHNCRLLLKRKNGFRGGLTKPFLMNNSKPFLRSFRKPFLLTLESPSVDHWKGLSIIACMGILRSPQIPSLQASDLLGRLAGHLVYRIQCKAFFFGSCRLVVHSKRITALNILNYVKNWG